MLLLWPLCTKSQQLCPFIHWPCGCPKPAALCQLVALGNGEAHRACSKANMTGKQVERTDPVKTQTKGQHIRNLPREGGIWTASYRGVINQKVEEWGRGSRAEVSSLCWCGREWGVGMSGWEFWASFALLLEARSNHLVSHREGVFSDGPAGSVVSKPPLSFGLCLSSRQSENLPPFQRLFFWCLADSQNAPPCFSSHSPKLSCNLSRVNHTITIKPRWMEDKCQPQSTGLAQS